MALFKNFSMAPYHLKSWLKQMFVYPTLTLSEVDYDLYWKDKRGGSIGALSDWQQLRADFIIKVVGKVGAVSFADIACGDGSILHYLSNHLPTKTLLGTDISEFAMARAREFGVKTQFLDVGDVNNLSKLPRADYLLLLEILEHVPHSEKLLEAAFAKADKGVFFSFPNTGFFVHRLRLFFGRFPLQWRLFPGEHVRYWTKRDLLWWLHSLQYEHFEIHYYKGIPFLNHLCPSWCAAAFVVFLPKDSSYKSTIR